MFHLLTPNSSDATVSAQVSPLILHTGIHLETDRTSQSIAVVLLYYTRLCYYTVYYIIILYTVYYIIILYTVLLYCILYTILLYCVLYTILVYCILYTVLFYLL